MQKSSIKKRHRPAQKQHIQPGKESLMRPLPEYENPNYKSAGKLKRKTASKYCCIFEGQNLHQDGGEIVNG